ncbi:MAG: glycosyltransferase family 4 protein [Candidatus Moranbacteria bacterium]|nr:glycosyltransferase family 4 protein [Candidatus Moranbacteria bacterium]
MKNKKLKIALLHDFLLYPGGAERVLKVLAEIFPEAPIYTLLYDKEKMSEMFADKDIRPSYLQKFPKFLKNHYQWLAPFFPVVPETFDLREYDLVISSSGAWMKGIVTKMSTTHIAYIHSPMRFVWDYNERYFQEKGRSPSLLNRFFLNYLRIWDRLAGDRPDFLIANSVYTQKRIEKYYRRESVVIYPPIISNQKSVISNQDNSNAIVTSYELPVTSYFLIVSRLSPYKKVDVVVEAFNKLGLPLIVIGQGEQKKQLKKIAKDNVKILGWQDDITTQEYFKNAKAFIFPAEDDFGITAVEAMNFGVPVIAYRKGGVLETVIEGATGEFFDAQTPEVLADGVRRFLDNEKKYDKDVIKKRGEEFSKERFIADMRKFIDGVLKK